MPATETLAAALADRYTIERLVGEGGMATVYLARDVRHNRRVALKVLRPDLGAVVGVERFLAEIQVTANLQHPNLLPLFDSGTAGDLLFYVMPYVEGESLRHRIDREKQLPVEEAIRLATAIGHALDYAHRQGVIHRDLKPENVLLQEGQPLVADFGIALAVSNAGGTRITQTGLSLGTPHYMSPEQATGDRVIDGRTDIYSLGALTYEMLTGEPPHVGSTSQAIIARVLTERPRSIRASRPNVPEHVEAAVEHALEKLPADRWSTAREFAEALSGARPVTRSATWGTAPMPAATPLARSFAGRPGIREVVAWMVAIAAVAAAAWTATRPEPVEPMARLAIEISDSLAANGSNFLARSSIALSPDGRIVAVVMSPAQRSDGISAARRSIMIRRLEDDQTRKLVGTEDASLPQFSRDGQWLAFIDGTRGLRRVPVAGGTPQLLADTATSVSWADDGTVYFTTPGGVWGVNAGGGRPRLVIDVDTTAGLLLFKQVEVLPGGTHAVVSLNDSSSLSALGLVDLRSGVFRDLGMDGFSPRYAEPGFLLYSSEPGVLSAIKFSSRNWTVKGEPVRIAEDVAQLANGGIDYDVALGGTIVFRWARGIRTEPTQLALVDLRGKTSVFREGEQRYDQPRSSPDGRYVVVRIGGSAFNLGDLWVVERASGALTRLTSNNNSYRAAWSRDGNRILYITGGPGTSALRSKPWDGSGTDTVLLDRSDLAEFAEGPPGGWSVLRTYAARDIFLVPTDSIATAQPRPFVRAPSNETDIALSPSGTLLAYQTDESGRYEIYVKAVPGPGPRVPVSIGGGTHAVWSRDGRTLYFRLGPAVMSATIVEHPAIAVTRRDTLFSAQLVADGVNLAVLPGGEGFVAAIGADAREANPFRIAVISNWQSLFDKPDARAIRQ